ncbi:FG-GAP repeat protein [uncultured Psychroserpens sp.]|uniref:FG-GAP repeat protein n=1 Tax=uncultured Psychroserpens sp. TaxID=255436 RepID=UPI002619C351|nr:FG-GAP repeat protein [uncultured Psychroserpens sp.]
MKTTYTLISFLLCTVLGFAQNGINYKALIKDNNGNVIASQPVTVQFIIYEGDALSNNVYQENHTVNTDINGFIITNIGEGTTSDDFSTVRWSNDEHYLNVQVDIGSGLIDLGTTQFMAVPYALSSGDHPWTKNENGVHTLNDDIGIKTDNPEHTLDVRSTSQTEASGFNLSNNDKSRYVRFFSGSEQFPDPSMSWAPEHNFLFATFDDNTLDFTEQMRISMSGDVGIGISDPEARLDVKGGDWNLDAGNPGDLRIGNSTHNVRFGVATGGGGAGITRLYSTNHLHLGVADESHMTIESGGDTGFGTTNPSQKVHINGKLKIGDDEKAPSEGTIRYNSTDKSFEGYDGTKWINLGGASSPYGVQGTFNFPNSSFYLSIPGSASAMYASQNFIAIKSRETITTIDPTFIPPLTIITDVIHVNVYKEGTDSNWSNVLSLSHSTLGSTRNSYAQSIALSENRLLIGDPDDNRVEEYNYQSGFWSNGHVFQSPDSSIDDSFGHSVAMFGNETIIGAPAYSVNVFTPVTTGPGKAYIYDGNDILNATLSGPGATLGDRFGTSVDISLNRAIVGAPGDSFGSISNAGSATIFNKFSGNWSTNNTFFNETPIENGFYGGVRLEGPNYLYIGGVGGIDAYLIEDGFWVLKETLSGNVSGYYSNGYSYSGHDKLVYKNIAIDEDKLDFLTTAERDETNFFRNTSSIINGTAEITSYDIVDNTIYTLGSDDRIYVFEY